MALMLKCRVNPGRANPPGRPRLLRLFLSGIAMGPDPQEPGSQPAATTQPPAQPVAEPVSSEELNAWRRGFTPQAEIWNGRLAMLGLAVGLTVLLIARLSHHS
jgi:hypothetical protein